MKVDKAITITIKKAIDEANRLAIKKAADAKKVLDNTNKATTPVTTNPKRVNPTSKKPEPEKQVSVLLNPENMAINANFINNRGSLPWPVDKGYLMMHYGKNQLPSGSWMDITCITVATDIGAPVKSIFDGVVSKVLYIDDMQVIVIQHGKYFSTYSNLGSVSVQTGQDVKMGQVIGKAAANLDGIGAIDFYINDERNNFDPEKWLRSR